MEPKENTIVASATPPGKGALAVIRLSGSRANTIVAEIIKEKEKFKRTEERKIALYTVIDKNGGIIDEVIAVKYISPVSFTGEDMVEITCHGSSLITKTIIEQTYRYGAQAASPGEFTRRAFDNKKIDLMKAEAIQALIDSTTSLQYETAKRAYTGKSREKIEEYKSEIIEILSQIEAVIEFGEEDDIHDSNTEITSILDNLKRRLAEEYSRATRIKQFENGLSVLLAGPVNAGKSSLFNKILGYERSIVHNSAGTTRDSVSESVNINGQKIRITDSAGLRETENEIENMGIEITRKEIKEAHLVIWVTSAEEPFENQELNMIENLGKNCVSVINKIENGDKYKKRDQLEKMGVEYITLSVKENINTDGMIKKIQHSINEIINNVQLPDIISNERHQKIVERIIENLSLAKENICREEIAAFYVRKNLETIEEICGYTTSEEVLNNIFSNFCIGK
ncbi:GTPase and tRNA-U34 5-formylation enzyme TrmE [Chitinispirillum alkaliphilum]|nr:GTPase and tRNA-U34 5-formylation enzyme TrmE [Chitinispirillum alkaliphilum]